MLFRIGSLIYYIILSKISIAHKFILMIEIKKVIADEVIEDYTYKKRKVFIFKWGNILPDGKHFASDKIFFNLDFEIEYKAKRDNNKIILIGEHNDEFWFFKIIKDAHDYSYKFSIKKPLKESVKDLKIYLVDWYKNIKEIDVKKMEIEYAVAKKI